MKKILVSILVLIFSIGTVSAVDLSNSGGGDWKYYREITIKENSGKTLTDYQVLIELNSANFDFSKAKPDGSDIRFVDLGENELSYWIEEWSPGKAKIWVKVPSIPANGQTKIKMYYGNPSANAVSDGDKTFEFFDDFEGTSLDTSKWCNYNANIGVMNSIVQISNSHAGFYTYQSFSPPVTIETKLRVDRDFGEIYSALRLEDRPWGVVWWYKEGRIQTAEWAYLDGVDSRDYGNLHDLHGILSIGWHRATIYWTVSNSKMVWDNGWEILNDFNKYQNYRGSIALGTWDDNKAWDWVLVRKYASPEPTPTISQEYPVNTTPLTLTKSVTPWSIKQGQETTVSVTVENIGTITIKDIEVKDMLSDDFEFVTGKTSAKYDEIKPGESRTFQYKIKSKEAGKFNLPKATALYADAQGNYHEIESGIPQVEVIASLVEETPVSEVTTPPATPTATPASTETPAKEKETPGFEAVFALAGLINALYLLRRLKGRKFLFLLLILTLSAGTVSASSAPVEEWEKTFGGPSYDAATSVQQTRDGGYIIAGITESTKPYTGYLWLLKTDSNGNEEWSKKYKKDCLALDVQQTRDKGYIVAGLLYSNYSINCLILKADSNGNEEWSKTFEDSVAFSVQQTRDGGYIIVGGTKTGNSCAWLLKMDANGNEEWSKIFGGYGDGALSIQQTSDGGYIIAGLTSSYAKHGTDIWLIKTDSNGNEEWNKTFGDFGNSRYEKAFSIQQISDGGYIITGFCQPKDRNVVLLKTDSSGNMEWFKTFGGSEYDFGSAVQQTSDGGYIIAGVTESFGTSSRGSPDIWIIKTDSKGNEEWNKTFGGTEYDGGFILFEREADLLSVQQTSDGGYIIAGTTCSYGENCDAWLIKLSTSTVTPIKTGTQAEESTKVPTEEPTITSETPGFGSIFAITGLLTAIYLVRRFRR